jgi:NarL family two-component system response regulator LiaR
VNLGKYKHVLVADDSFTVRQVLKRYLTSRGDVVVCGEAVNGREAVQRAMALKPDLVLLDLAMPELNGAEVASVLKGAIPDTRIILFTMYRQHWKVFDLGGGDRLRPFKA